MAATLHLSIKFKKGLKATDEDLLWESLIDEIENMGLSAGGGQDTYDLDWAIDCSEAKLPKSAIIQKLERVIHENRSFIEKIILI